MISTHINKMREKLRAGQVVLGCGISVTDPAVTEAIAPSVDFVWIDLVAPGEAEAVILRDQM